MTPTWNVSLIQVDAREDRSANIQSALHLCENAAKQGAQLIVLPEVFSLRSDRINSAKRAERIPGPSTAPFMQFAADHGVWVLCGSVIESGQNGLFYNSSVLINDKGQIGYTYRKMHLFDVALTGKKIQESSQFSAGTAPSLAEIMGVKMGLSICYDLRFPELYRHYSRDGAQVLCVPSSFTEPTGKAHWEVLLRARAIENQCFVLAPNQVGIGAGGIPTYGCSMIVDPWGTVLAKGSSSQAEIVSGVLSFERLETIRKELPALKHRKL